MKTCNVKESENPESIPLSGLAPIVSNSLFWADTHPPSRFHGSLFGSSCVFLLAVLVYF